VIGREGETVVVPLAINMEQAKAETSGKRAHRHGKLVGHCLSDVDRYHVNQAGAAHQRPGA